MFDVVHRAARADPRIVFIGSDIAPGLLAEMHEELPGQFFMEGIQEQHLIGMAAGLALEGLRPVVSTISTFLVRRCFEQIFVDAALHELPIVLLGTGSGLAYSALGPTHCAVDDFALLRTIPGITLISAADTIEAGALLEQVLETGKLAYIRVPRGDERPLASDLPPTLGRGVVLAEGGAAMLVSTGRMTGVAEQARQRLSESGTDVRHVHVHTIKPLDNDVVALAAAAPLVISIEEHRRDGGLGTALLEALADAGTVPPLHRIGISDEMVSGYGTHDQALEAAGLTVDAICDAVS